MRYIIIIILVFFGQIEAQTKINVDSLKTALAKAKTDKAKAEITFSLIEHYNKNNPDSNAIYLKLAKGYVKQTKDKKLQARYYLAEANQLQNLTQFNESIKANQKAIELFEELNDNLGLASSYNTLGLTYKKNSGDDNQVIGFSEKALEYENKALEYYRLADDFDGLLRVYSNIGIILRDLKRFKEAETSYLKAIALAESKNYRGFSLGVLKANLSQIYLDYYKKHNKAIDLLNEAIELYDLNGVYANKEHAFRNISYNYTELNEYDKAIFYANKAIKIANEVKDPHRQIMAYSSLHHAQKMKGMYKESMENLEFLNDIEDSLFSMEKTSLLAEMAEKFEAVKKDARIQVLTKTNELNRWRIWALIAGLIALGALVFSLVQKRKKDKLISGQNAAIELQKRESAEFELESKKKELTAKVLQLARKNEFLISLETEVDHLKTNVDSSVNKTSGRISRMIKRDIANDNQWEKFSDEFSGIHKGFLKELTEKHGNFTKSELRLIALLKMNLSSKEIADILGISADGIKKARYRLRKKMNLEDSQLQSYLLNLSA
jgi:tetratricopeptide (TPR) repeat protein/DNA-binding CsgD family transcriptional regulator